MGAGNSRRKKPRELTVTSEAWDTQCVSDISNLDGSPQAVAEGEVRRNPIAPPPDPPPKDLWHPKTTVAYIEAPKSKEAKFREDLSSHVRHAGTPESKPREKKREKKGSKKSKRYESKKSTEKNWRPQLVYEVPESSLSDQEVGTILSQLEADLPLPATPEAPPPSVLTMNSDSQVLSLSENGSTFLDASTVRRLHDQSKERVNSQKASRNTRRKSPTGIRRKPGDRLTSAGLESTISQEPEWTVGGSGHEEQTTATFRNTHPKMIEGFDFEKFKAANEKKQRRDDLALEYDYGYDDNVDYLEVFGNKSDGGATTSKVHYDPHEEALLSSIEKEYGGVT